MRYMVCLWLGEYCQEIEVVAASRQKAIDAAIKDQSDDDLFHSVSGEQGSFNDLKAEYHYCTDINVTELE